MKLDQFGMILFENFCDKNTVGEVSAEIAFGSAEGEAVNPFKKLLHLVLIYWWGLH